MVSPILGCKSGLVGAAYPHAIPGIEGQHPNRRSITVSLLPL
jgi:hypothetical protein